MKYTKIRRIQLNKLMKLSLVIVGIIFGFICLVTMSTDVQAETNAPQQTTVGVAPNTLAEFDVENARPKIDEGIWSYEVQDGRAIITAYNGPELTNVSQTDVSIPANLGGYPVAINMSDVFKDAENVNPIFRNTLLRYVRNFKIEDSGNQPAVKILDEDLTGLFAINYIYKGPSGPNSVEGNRYIETIDFTNADFTSVKIMDGMFAGLDNLTEMNLDQIQNAKPTSLKYMFSVSKGILQVSLKGLDTSQVTDMSYMFANAENVRSIDMSSFDNSNATNITRMFSAASKLEKLILPNTFKFGGDINALFLRLPKEPTYWIKESDGTIYKTRKEFALGHDAMSEEVETYLFGVPIDITFDTSGFPHTVTTPPEKQTIIAGKTARDPKVVSDDGNYVITDWYYTADNKEVIVDFDNQIFESATTLQVKNYRPRNYRLVFYNGEDKETSEEETVDFNSEIKLVPRFSKPGYQLTGWKAEDGTIYQVNQMYSHLDQLADGAEVSFVAQWKANPVTPTPPVRPELPNTGGDRFPLYRVYNLNNGEHLYTMSQAEAQGLIALGWQDEGIGWYGGQSEGKAVYRIYNQNSGEHFYTLDEGEYEYVAKAGWTKEGIAFYAAENTEIPIYRTFNPNSKDAGSHHYTVSDQENTWLVEQGWVAEGTAFYGK